MRCRYYIINCLSTAVVLLVSSQLSTSAQTLLINNVEPTAINQLATPQQVTIPPIKQTEITPVVTTEPIKNQQDLLVPPRLSAVITRDITNLWQMRVPIEQVPLLYATYELKAINGTDNVMSNNISNNSSVPVLIEPLPIVEVSRDLNSKTAVVQGGVRLTMDLLNTRFAGNYTASMTVTVNQR